MKTTANFKEMKQSGEKIVMLTAYDFPTGTVAEQAGVDILLVGDSLGMVVLGYDSTISVTLSDMIHHAKATRRGAPHTFMVVDMPFGTFQGSDDRILQQALPLFQESGANALKVEGADEVLPVIQLLTRTGIPVVGHLGLLPQMASVAGGYRVQGKTASAAEKLIQDAKLCEEAGAVMLVVECIPHQLAKRVAEAVTIPVIGIGAGMDTDGQVLVFHDLVGFGSHHIPKFVQQFQPISSSLLGGIEQYVQAVKHQTFPTAAHHFTMTEEQVKLLEEEEA